MRGPIIVGLAVFGMIAYYLAGEQKDKKSWCEARNMVTEIINRRLTCVDRQGKESSPTRTSRS
jgi:hypothetical protein